MGLIIEPGDRGRRFYTPTEAFVHADARGDSAQVDRDRILYCNALRRRTLFRTYLGAANRAADPDNRTH